MPAIAFPRVFVVFVCFVVILLWVFVWCRVCVLLLRDLLVVCVQGVVRG